jgi:DeoR/GlpR family transcriptional regulator of sugar metabolism
MLAQVRQARILDEVHRTGEVRVSDLTTLLGVSDMTIRRDLDALDRKGLVAKVHGGATAVETLTTIEPNFEARSVREMPEKEVIAAQAASLVRPGMAIGLTAGTTTWTLARHLADIPDLTVVTNSLRVADVLNQHQRPDHTVVLTGGVRTPSDGLVGPIAVQTIRSLRVDMMIMGVHGFDEKAGLTTPNLMEAETNRALVDSARRLVVVADHTKWGITGLAQIAPLRMVSTFISDDRLPPHAADLLRGEVGELILMPAPLDDDGDDATASGQ